MTTRYLFIIDTSDYAGNFERNMCAYITGHVGECGVGQAMADLYGQEWSEPMPNVIECPDDNGCHRPAQIWVEPKSDDMNSVAISFDPDHPPTKKQIRFMKERAEEFLKRPKFVGLRERIRDVRPERILGFRLLREETYYVEESI